MRRLAAGFGLSLLLAAAAASLEPLPEPGEANSHARYLEVLHEAQERRADELLARYERRLAEAPHDAVAAVERCRFLGAGFFDPETEENPRHEEFVACVSSLERDFADDPVARVYGIEERWGDEAREAAETFLAEPPAAAEPKHLAAVHAHLARVGEASEWEGVASHAEQAMALDPSLDLRLLLARARQYAGDGEGARAALREGLLTTEARWELEQKAALLLELGAIADARAAFREAESREGVLGHRAEYAQTLTAAGEIDAARAVWAEAGEGWLSNEDLRARFDFELAHGGAASARAAYDALRARGWDQDPLGADRLALLTAHPAAAWKLEDATPLALVILMAFVVSLLPALWILPVAWAGLARQSRLAPEAARGFGLHHAWAVSALVLLTEVLTALAYFQWSEEDLTSLAPGVFARYALVSTVASLCAVLFVVRGRLSGLLGRGAWSWRRTVGAAVAGMIALQAGFWLAEQATGSSGSDPVTEEMVRSVTLHYGLEASLILVALVTPVTEELAFRGVLLSAFGRALAPRWANLAQALLFGLAHAHPLVTPFTFAMGLLGGWMTRRSGTLRPVLLMHILNNAAACAALAV